MICIEAMAAEGGSELSERIRIEFPIPGKHSAVVEVPEDFKPEDWALVSATLSAYIERLKVHSSVTQAAPR